MAEGLFLLATTVCSPIDSVQTKLSRIFWELLWSFKRVGIVLSANGPFVTYCRIDEEARCIAEGSAPLATSLRYPTNV